MITDAVTQNKKSLLLLLFAFLAVGIFISYIKMKVEESRATEKLRTEAENVSSVVSYYLTDYARGKVGIAENVGERYAFSRALSSKKTKGLDGEIALLRAYNPQLKGVILLREKEVIYTNGIDPLSQRRVLEELNNDRIIFAKTGEGKILLATSVEIIGADSKTGTLILLWGLPLSAPLFKNLQEEAISRVVIIDSTMRMLLPLYGEEIDYSPIEIGELRLSIEERGVAGGTYKPVNGAYILTRLASPLGGFFLLTELNTASAGISFFKVFSSALPFISVGYIISLLALVEIFKREEISKRKLERALERVGSAVPPPSGMGSFEEPLNRIYQRIKIRDIPLHINKLFADILETVREVILGNLESDSIWKLLHRFTQRHLGGEYFYVIEKPTKGKSNIYREGDLEDEDLEKITELSGIPPHLVAEDIASPRLSDRIRKALLRSGVRQVVSIPFDSSGKGKGFIVLGLKKTLEWKEESGYIAGIFSKTGEIKSNIEHLRDKFVHVERSLKEKGSELSYLLEQLEISKKTRTNFLQAVTHELRTPLNTILGFSELLVSGNYGELKEDQRQAVQNVYEGAKSLLTLINDIIDIAKIELDEETINPELINIEELLNRVIKLTGRDYEKLSIKIKCDIEPEAKTVTADERKLKQILYNILENAVKYTTGGGEIEIKVKRMGEQVFFSIRDTGMGLRRSDLTRIFEPFVQIELGEVGKIRGIGLGLAIAKHYVNLHGGEIWAESEGLGKGTTVFFTIPISTFHFIEREKKVLPDVPQGPEDAPLILIIDKDPHSIELAKKILIDNNYKVLIASTAKEARKLLDSYIPQAILMDILLPDTDGWEFIKYLKTTPRFSSIPVIVTSILDYRERARELNIEEYVVKPISSEMLLEIIKKLQLTSPPPTIFVIKSEESENISNTLRRMGFNVEIISRPQEEGMVGLNGYKNVVTSWRDLPRILARMGKEI